MKKITKILISVFIPVILLTSLTFGLVFRLKQDTKDTENGQQLQTVEEKPAIPGVYYASAGEETGASSAPLSAKAGSIYVGPGVTYNMTGGIVKNHTAIYGGAVYVAACGTFNMTGGTIMFNQAVYGGAIYVEAGGTINITGGVITGNKGTAEIEGYEGLVYAPAIYVEGEVGVTTTVTVGGTCRIENNYNDIYDNYVAYYVDGALASVAALDLSDGAFDLSTAPLDYEHCNGYFSDKNLTKGVEHGELLVSNTNVQSVAVVDIGIVRLYTRTATPEKLTFTLNSGNATYNVKQIDTTTTTGVIVIPREYDGKTVTAIYDSNTNASGAFSNNNGITEIFYPSSVTSIGFAAFRDCTGLTKVTIPDSVTSIEGYAFVGCNNISSVYYGGDIASWCGITFGSSWTNSNWTLYINDDAVTSLVVPNTVTTIPAYAFSYCTSLTSVTIPNGVTSIDTATFERCTNLAEVTIPVSVTLIYTAAFYGCTGLTEIIIPEGVTQIGNLAFYGCTGLTSVTIPETIIYYPDLNVYGIFTDSSTGSFVGCTNVQNLTAPYITFQKGVIPTTSLVNITVTSGALPNNAFYNIDTLETVVLLDGVTSVGNMAFYSNDNLTSITLPSTLTSLGNQALAACTSLERINYTGDLAGWFGFTHGQDWAISSSAFDIYIGGSKLTDVVVPTSITQISSNVFMFCKTIESLTITANVQSIGTNAFWGSGINSVTFEQNGALTTINGYSFAGCTNLYSIVIPNGVTSIGDGVFIGCTALTSVTIPSTVTSIGTYAFYNCTSLQTVKVDSGTIAGWSSTNSNLLDNATTVYVKDTISSVGTYITNSFTLQGTSDKAGYKKYVKNA